MSYILTRCDASQHGPDPLDQDKTRGPNLVLANQLVKLTEPDKTLRGVVFKDRSFKRTFS